MRKAVRVKNKAVFVALASLPEGRNREVLGYGLPNNEGAKFCFSLMKTIWQTGRSKTSLIAVVDGLKSFSRCHQCRIPRQSTTCIVKHSCAISLNFCGWKDLG